VNVLAVVLTNDLSPPEPIAITVALHQQGFEAAIKTLDDGSVAFDLGSGAELAVVHFPTQHPEPGAMRRGPTTPSVDKIGSAGGHIVLGALHLDRLVGPNLEAIDRLMLRVTSAVVTTTDAVAAMLGHGVYFHEARIFTALTVLYGEQRRVPAPIVINVTNGQSLVGRLTMLTHGLSRYGRMELLVGCTDDMDSSSSYIWQMIEWLMADELNRLVPGTLVPRDDGSEQVAQGVPSPLGDGSAVVYIELGR
jgi:hypothetical protein